MSKIDSAVIPVAGVGTRLLPSTKSQPKEMLPVGRKPVVQYVVEEFENSGLTRILFVTGKSKRSIEDHFDFDQELNGQLLQQGKRELAEALAFSRSGVRFFYTRQSKPLGPGHAILLAEDFVGGSPFVVGFGDSIIKGQGSPSLVQRLIHVFDEKGASCVIALEEVPWEDVSSYGIAVGDDEDGSMKLTDVIEKPQPGQAPTNLAIAARYVLSPAIFDALRGTTPGIGGEIWLTDAIKLLIQRGEKVYGVPLRTGEKRYDIGNFQSYFKSFVDFALGDEEFGPDLREYLSKKLKTREP